MDAMDSKKKKRSTMESKESSEGTSTGFKQFFSLNKKSSVSEFFFEFGSNVGLKYIIIGRGGEVKAEAEAESSALKSTSLRDRLRLSLTVTPVAFVRREGKRRIID
jgi:hypothetical protein